MPVPIFEFRLSAGWITAAVLNASSSFLVQNFAVQSDQNPWSQPWGPPIDHKTMYPRRQVSTVNEDFSQTLRGFYQFDWIFAYWTEGMVSFFESTYFAGAGSGLVTVKTILRTGVYEEFQGTMLYPNEEELFDPSERGIENYKLRFRGLTIV